MSGGGDSSDGLADACAELQQMLTDLDACEFRNGAAAAGLHTVDNLLSDADIAPAARRKLGYESRAPWNAEVAAAIMDAHELIRRLEASLRIAVTGHPGPRRGGSAAATSAALTAIENLGRAVSERDRRQTARLIYRHTRIIGQLPSVDTVPRLERIRRAPGGMPVRCPGTCQTYSLRVEIISGVVMCVFSGDCRDLDGRRPQARLELSRLTGDPQLCWRDGTVGIAPAACHVQAAEPEPAEPEHVEHVEHVDPAADLNRRIRAALG